MRLDNSAGDTSMKRRKEKQLPLSSPGTVKTEYRMKTVRRNKQTNKQKKNGQDANIKRRNWGETEV